ncbi:MAG: aldolase/citrate lyase family protein, partial [Gemmatimonadota bacterium]|nr:aldolase/citrate lyase family protein [Gemmatimonadota bacterium]
VSKVAALYGAAIEAEARRVCEALGVAHARLRIDDRGALDPVVAARVEAALRRAGVEGGDARPARRVPVPAPTARDRPRRSRLYLPGDQPRFVVNAALHGPDAVILDLEDSVHPDHKDAARLVVRNLLRTIDFLGAERMVRINPLPLGLEDLDEVVPEGPDLVLVPKTEDPDTVRTLGDRIDGLTDRPVWLMPILETALGVERALDIAAASDRVVALTIGLEDYTADLGVRKTVEGSESLYARARLVNAARAAGVQPIDSVFGDVGDEDGLRAWAARSQTLGFEGMGCVHPRQIGPIHEAFDPSPAELERALAIVAAFDEAERRGLGVVSLGTRMIDPPVVKRAQRTVRLARLAGLLPQEAPDA